jgi:hypothetical protein
MSDSGNRTAAAHISNLGCEIVQLAHRTKSVQTIFLQQGQTGGIVTAIFKFAQTA